MNPHDDTFAELASLQTRLAKIKQAIDIFGGSTSVPASLKAEQFSVEQQILKLRDNLASTAAELTSPEGLPVARRPQAFVIMPFKSPYNDYYRDILKPAIQDLGYDCIRSDEIYSPGAFLQTIWEQIVNADVMIAEMTGMNPNVLYELGLAHSLSKKVIMITQDMNYIPSDLRHINCVVYDTSGVSWSDKLRNAIQRMVLFRAQEKVDFIVLHPKATVDNTVFFEKLARDREFFQERTIKLEAQIAKYATHTKDLKAQLAIRAQVNTAPGTLTEAARWTVGVDDSDVRVFCERLPVSDLAIEYVEIEKGPFLFGPRTSATEIDLDTFYITRFAITNSQFCTFVNAVGNRMEAGVAWIDLLGRSPSDKCRIVRNEQGVYAVEAGYEEHPVTYVNYYGAAAFCAWAGGQLPTVEEWEKAVRGVDGHEYPWGNNPPTPELTNVEDGGWPRDVAPIEVYRKTTGASRFGVIQGIGNVWHWTSMYYPDRDMQAVRGGSFFDFRLGKRSVYRFLVQPNGPDFSQGFLMMKRFVPLVVSESDVGMVKQEQAIE
jgi:formylglycine-generating enzyme required for sulfatase activity